MGVVGAQATELFIGTVQAPLQVVRVTLDGGGPATILVRGERITTPTPATTDGAPDTVVEVGVDTGATTPGETVTAEAVVEYAGSTATVEFPFTVAEAGWTMHMVSHFHYDPVWWNTQAAYTVSWDQLDFPGSPRGARQLAGFDLVRAHLDLALTEPEYRFVLAEVDYLKPYWDTFPADRAVLRRLIDEGRVEVLGGAYNEPNTNLTDPETTVRNFVHGMGFQRDVLGATPATAWQLDAFGHDPAFPGLAADAGLTSSSWARGPFHQWGPMERTDTGKGDPTRMQFPSEFEWISPSGRGLLTSYMTDHYGSGWTLDSAVDLDAACEAAYGIFRELKRVTGTREVLLPVGGDYTPPAKWVTRVHREFARRYVWPRFVCSLPRDFFAAVRESFTARGVDPSPQTRDMNPIYTGKDVSYIDTKQAQRAAEVAVLEAEAFAVFARLLAGAGYPDAALAKAWVQLAYGAHHDGITGSESDQVYLDLVTGWRDAHDLAADVRARSLTVLSNLVAGDGTRVVVWNSLNHARTDVVTVRLAEPLGGHVTVTGEDGTVLPCLVEHGGASVSFLAADVPALGWRAFRLATSARPGTGNQDWVAVDGLTAASDRFTVTVDPARGGGVSSLLDMRDGGCELIAPGRVGNELAVYAEYPSHPRFGEGPWHLLPRGPVTTSGSSAADVAVSRGPLGERITVTGAVGPVRYTQTITVWRGVSRVDCVTTVDEFTGEDQLLRVRWPCPVPGALPVSEVGNAVVGRGFGLIDVDSAEHPWTLDNPAHTWFGLSSAAALRLADGALRPIGVAEIIVPSLEQAALARPLAVALARCGVTSTVSAADGARYGALEVDSNLPDVRIALGGAAVNAFTADVLARQGIADADGLRWVTPDKPLAQVWRPSADLRDARALGVLVAAGPDLPGLVESLVDDLADRVVEVGAGDPGQPPYERRSVAVLNRGLPGFAVDTGGTLHTSLLRSCTGWPSGVWIDPPRRTVPDGSNFQLQHWTHEFHYALTAGDGDWRAAGIAQTSAEFNRPLHAVVTDVVTDGPGGALPAAGSLLRAEPAGLVRLAAVKAAGNPLTRGSGLPADPARQVALRLVAHTGSPVSARLASDVVSFGDLTAANLLEEPARSLPGQEIEVPGCDAVTVLATPAVESLVDTPVTGVLAEPTGPLFAKYWLHNRGPAPLGGLPLAVHLHPTPDQRVLELTVASGSTDVELSGLVRLALPDGWHATPDEVPFGLPPGGHLSTTVTVTAPADPPDGRYPVRASVTPAGDLPGGWGQTVEDVAVLTVGSPPEEGLLRLVGDPSPVRLAPGEAGRLAVRVASGARAPVAVEAALVSPWGTWELAGPRLVGAELPGGGEVELAFDVVAPPWARPGRWWALIRVAGAGRLLYSPAVALEVTA
ncbi:alpha-mannosidase [Actinophytocola xinjiangensis]|uniref:Alpha-mannosidase n=1 Tax=Actinophytocola xinjiangensis TaxID=485602 RepID=A0A7Z0WD33_9PSEU|nr:NEW3 domain-containing protein [Actinophytocola xinjiangensis]OLF04546.1 alpha-mannosidase [Actinophytocola xinjiangensis]